MPLETLREPVTPVGLHYLLIHYDIPPRRRRDVAPDGRRARRAASSRLTLDELRARPAPHEVVATMECAGNGRAKLEPRADQPAVAPRGGRHRPLGAARRCATCSTRPASADAAPSRCCSPALDRGIENGEEQWFQRSLPLAEALRAEVLLAYDLNGAPLPPQHGFPLRLLVPGWYGMTNVKWLSRITRARRAVPGYQQARGYRLRQDPDEPGEPLAADPPASAAGAARHPRVHDPRADGRAPARARLAGRAWSGHAPIAAVDVSVDGGATWDAGDARADDARRVGVARLHVRLAAPTSPGRYVLCCRARDEAGNEQPLEPRGTSAATRTTPSSASSSTFV